jgi:hypothetical protein
VQTVCHKYSDLYRPERHHLYSTESLINNSSTRYFTAGGHNYSGQHTIPTPPISLKVPEREIFDGVFFA